MKAPALAYVVAYIVLFSGGLVYGHWQLHGSLSPTQIALSVFNAVNAWICFCEIALYLHAQQIQRDQKGLHAKWGLGRLPPLSELFLFEWVPPSAMLSTTFWSKMWSTYAQLDTSYVETSSFGFCVDVGNGFSTIVPSVLYSAAMTYPILSPRWLGMIGLVMYYQELYGTLVYYFQYFYNGRPEAAKSSAAIVWGVVVPANALWVLLPLLGIWASGRLILDDSFEVFSHADASSYPEMIIKSMLARLPTLS